MKVRLLNLAALSAIAMGAQGLAQEQGDSLERALADLNSGIVAPQGATNTVSASGSAGLNITGDARIRNTWINPSGNGPGTLVNIVPAGGISDMKNVDARVRVGMAFDVNQDASAFVQLNGHENWGNPGIGPNMATGEAFNINTGSFNQAWFAGKNVILEGEEWVFGRRYYTLGSGRILGTDEWNQLPASYSGVWYSHPLEGWNFHGFMITDFFNAGGLNGNFLPGGDRDLFGATVDYSTDAIPMLDMIHIKPYVLRLTQQQNPTGTRNWYGANVTGAINIVNYDVEAVWVDSDRNHDPSTSSYNAWAADLDIDLGEWIQDMPGNINPVLELGIAQADQADVTINPLYHGVAGIYDYQMRIGRPGVWSGAMDTWQGGVSLEPVAGWTGRVAYIHFNDNIANAVHTDGDEVDVTVSHMFHNGVALWAGWGWVDFNTGSSDAYIVYGTLSLPF